jgi:hypothetical protein
LSDPFGSLEVPFTKADTLYHVFLENTGGVARNNQSYTYNSSVVFTIYQKGFKDVSKAFDKLLQRVERFLVNGLNPESESGIMSVTLDRVDYEALSTDKNDNFLVARINYNVRHELCLVEPETIPEEVTP